MTMLENEKLNGVELYFEEKPSKTVIDNLKDGGFKWHTLKKCWYAKKNDKTVKVLATLNIEAKQLKPAEKTTENGVKIGDIFVMSWGWEQTNVDAYQVVNIKGKSTVILRAINIETVESTGAMSSIVRPVKDSFVEDEEAFEKRVKIDGSTYINMKSYANAYLHTEGRTYTCTWYG